VVERAVLSKVLLEQELSQNKLASPFTQVQAGQLLGVDYMIVGDVTEFEEQALSGGGAVGFFVGLGPKVSSDFSAAHVGIDMRIIDTRTGEILCSHRAEGKAWGNTFGIQLKNGLVDFGGELFHKTPLGKATRRAIESALNFVLEVAERQTKDFSWLARVIETSGYDVYIDAGRMANVAVGDRLRVSDVDKVLNDPETNEILGLVEREAGVLQVVQVEAKYARARVIQGTRPAVGALVRFESETKQSLPRRVSQAGYRIMD
jgi:hypothetical protein